jgi:hypothetical protein
MLKQEITEETKLGCGKCYRGKALKDVPARYLLMLQHAVWLPARNPRLRRWIFENTKALRARDIKEQIV